MNEENGQEVKLFSEIVSDAIKERFLTYLEASEVSGVTVSAISRFMRGERTLRLDSIEKLWPHLGLSVKPAEIDEIIRTKGFDAALRTLIETLGQNELQFANKAGMNQSTLWRYIHKGGSMKLPNMELILAATPVKFYRGSKRVDLVD